MAVSPDFSDRLIYDFKEKSAQIIDRYGLNHLRGTEKMDPATNLAAEFINLAQQSTTNPTITESMLQSEQRMYLKTLEHRILEVSKNQAMTLNGLRAQALGQSIIANADWDKTVTAVAKEVDRIAVKNSDLINSLTKEEQEQMDKMFASVVDNVRIKHGADPSVQSAKNAERAAVQDLRRVEKQLEQMAKQSIIKRQNDIFNDFNEQLGRYLETLNQLRKAMKPEEVKKANQQVASIKRMMRELKTNKRFATDREMLQAHIGMIQNEFKNLNAIESDISETVAAVTGIYGSTARRTNRSNFSIGGNLVTVDDIKKNHPEAKNPAHIRSMQYFMNQGLTFDQAHEASKAYGYEVNDGVRNMDLDYRVNYLGQATEFDQDSHTLKEDSFGRKLLNVGGAGVGGGVVLAVLGLGALVAYSKMSD